MKSIFDAVDTGTLFKHAKTSMKDAAIFLLQPRDVVPGKREYVRIEAYAAIDWGGYENEHISVREVELITEWRPR